MAESEGGGRNWLACGCIGCIGLVVLLLLGLAGVFGTAWVGVRNEEVSQRSSAPAIQVPPGSAGKPGRLVLRSNSGMFELQPAPAGETLRVEARFDERSYELTERFEQDDERWSYEVGLERRSSMLMSFLKMMVGGTDPHVDVHVPVDVPLDLVVEIHQGGSKLDLGGLWIRTAQIDFDQGGFELDVSEPLREPMESFTIDGTMGGFSVRSLGNASPRRLDVSTRMGGMDLDLRGPWMVDSEISISTSQGGASVRLPGEVNIVGIEQGRILASGDEEIPRPTLTFSVSSADGEVEFVE